MQHKALKTSHALTIVIAGMLLAIGPVLPDKPTLAQVTE